MSADDNPSPIVFDKQRAANYDKQWAKLAPMKQALHLYIRVLFSELADDAHILCIGVGTGAELLSLAEAHPSWQFTAVEPAEAMLNRCRARAAAAGVSSRCTFHHGYLDSLPASEPFAAATSLLVSHFMLKPDERRDYFRHIATRLRPGGYLVSADLASDMSSPEFKSLFEAWEQMLKYAELPAEVIDKFRGSCGRDVAVLPPAEVGAMIKAGGFDEPVLFFQALLIHAWYAKRTMV